MSNLFNASSEDLNASVGDENNNDGKDFTDIESDEISDVEFEEIGKVHLKRSVFRNAIFQGHKT